MTNTTKLIIGQKLEKKNFFLKEIKSQGDVCRLSLSDKTGSFPAIARKEQIGGLTAGTVVCVTAIAKPGEDILPLLAIKEIFPAETGSYQVSEIFDGLSEEKVNEYTSIIRWMETFVHHEGYKKLLAVTLTDEVIRRLSRLPASLSYYGKYPGGALAVAAVVTLMAKDSGVEYVKHMNGLHSRTIDWSLLITAGLLGTYGTLRYFTGEAPFRKTPEGVLRGYGSLLQSMIEKSILLNDIPLTDEECGKLLNVILCSFTRKSGITPTTREALLLQRCASLYADLDMLDMCISQQEEKTEDIGEYFYSENLRKYITL